MVNDFGKILRIIRINCGDSARTMASKLGMSASYLSAIETGKRYIPDDIDKWICQHYELSEYDKKKLRDSIVTTKKVVKIDLTELSEKKKNLLIAISDSGFEEDMLDRLCETIQLNSKQ